jgi:arylsulfatase
VDFATDRWELYDIAHDFSQAEDLAAKFPEKLKELQEHFLLEAAKHDVFPLDDRFVERVDITLRPGFFSGRKHVTLLPGMVRLPEGAGPKTSNVDHAITVHAELPAKGAEGVLICLGGDNAGWSLFVDEGRLRYHYNWYTYERYDVVATRPLPRGKVVLRMEFVCEMPGKPGGPARVRLLCNDAVIGEGRVEKQVRGRFSETLDVGEDTLSPVWPGYRSRLPFRFTGTIERVELALGEAARETTQELLEEHLRRD